MIPFDDIDFDKPAGWNRRDWVTRELPPLPPPDAPAAPDECAPLDLRKVNEVAQGR